MKNSAEEIAALNSQIAELQSRLTTLEAQQSRRALSQAEARDEGVRITQVIDTGRFVMPSDEELRSLYETVLVHFPQLRPLPDNDRFGEDDDPDVFRDFTEAFEYIGNVERTKRPNSRYALSFFVDGCNQSLAARQKRRLYKVDAFLMAVLAHGDIPYTPADLRNGVVWEIGL